MKLRCEQVITLGSKSFKALITLGGGLRSLDFNIATEGSTNEVVAEGFSASSIKEVPLLSLSSQGPPGTFTPPRV